MVLFLLTEVCKPGYCANGGICRSVGNKPTCICQPGFTGPQCQTKIGTYCFLKFIVSLVVVKSIAVGSGITNHGIQVSSSDF